MKPEPLPEKNLKKAIETKYNVERPKKVAIFDLDGTLFDTQKRYNACLDEVHAKSLDELKGKPRVEFWECYQSEKYMDLDEPVRPVINMTKELKKRDYMIVVLSGRMERQREKTVEQLKKYDIPYDALILRKEGDFRKDYEYKWEVIKYYLSLGYKVVVFDDSEKVRELYPQGSYDPKNLPSPDEL